MRNFVNNVQLLNANLINLVQNVNTRHVHAIALNHVNQVVAGRVVPERKLSLREMRRVCRDHKSSDGAQKSP